MLCYVMMAGRVASNVPWDPNHSEKLSDAIRGETHRKIHVESEPKYLHALRPSGPHV
jgi:hypothetical protein